MLGWLILDVSILCFCSGFGLPPIRTFSFDCSLVITCILLFCFTDEIEKPTQIKYIFIILTYIRNKGEVAIVYYIKPPVVVTADSPKYLLTLPLEPKKNNTHSRT